MDLYLGVRIDIFGFIYMRIYICMGSVVTSRMTHSILLYRSSEVSEYYQLVEAGADSVCIQERDASYNMFSSLINSLQLTISPTNTYNTERRITCNDDYIQNLRNIQEQKDIQYIEKRINERSTRNQNYRVSNRVNVPDTASYFESLKRTVSG